MLTGVAIARLLRQVMLRQIALDAYICHCLMIARLYAFDDIMQSAQMFHLVKTYVAWAHFIFATLGALHCRRFYAWRFFDDDMICQR